MIADLLPTVIGIALVSGAFLYVWWIAQFRNKATADMMDEPDSEELSDTELERYARHIVLRELGGAGQAKLRASKILMIGVGGLGNPALQYLAAAGVGTLGFIDDDEVSLSNLQRQVLFSEDDLGMPKVFAAERNLANQNPFVAYQPYHRKISIDIAQDLISEFDLVIDGCDNFETRTLVNAACVATKTPLISGAITQWEGQITLFDPANANPCYACIFPEEPAAGLAPSCAEAGVVGALPGIVGSMMALEAIKFIAGAGKTLVGTMFIYDGLYGESRNVKLKKNPECRVCS